MNRSIEVLKKIYKPYKYTILGKVTILNTTSGDLVVKEKSDKNIKELYNYLASRNFTAFPPLIDDARDGIDIFKYEEDTHMPKEQKAMDLINVIASLHNKTTYYKVVTADSFKEIYDNIQANIIYYKNYYNKLYDTLKHEIYMSPASYLLMRNISKIFSALDFAQSELDKWFDLVKNSEKKRVSLIHNNLEINHFIKNEQDYLISWDKSRVDSPIMDLINFYHKEYFNVDFSSLWEMYLGKVSLTEDEKKLFYIIISLPKEINLNDTEFNSCLIVRELLDYLYITENLIRPYYSVEQNN